jgi:hypothetical protein
MEGHPSNGMSIKTGERGKSSRKVSGAAADLLADGGFKPE